MGRVTPATEEQRGARSALHDDSGTDVSGATVGEAEEMIEPAPGKRSRAGGAGGREDAPEPAQIAQRRPGETRRVSRFLEALGETGNVSDACRIAGVPRRTAYDLRERDEEFSRGWEDALKEGADVLEREARRRAVEGLEEPMFYRGEVVGHVRRYSDSVLMFLLRGNRPEKYVPGHLDEGRIRREAQAVLLDLFVEFLEEVARREGIKQAQLLGDLRRFLDPDDKS